jgi:two-component system phosphate regulon response regulator PhoB
LLLTLVVRRDRVQERSTLLSDVWEVAPGVSSRTVDTHVKRLRDKLGTAGRFIQTVRGVGYRFSENPDDNGSP